MEKKVSVREGGTEKLNEWGPRILSLVRIVTALLFIEHGAMKLFHFPAPQPGVPERRPPILMAAALLELCGGTLMLLGLFTRPVAFLLTGQMAIGYFLVHFPN